MNAADVAVTAVIVGGAVDLAAIGAVWSLVKSGRVRLSSPTPAQMQAEHVQPQVTAEPAPAPLTVVEDKAS